MTQEFVQVTEYADDLVSVPKAHLSLELRQDEGGVSLLHDTRLLVECPLTKQGIIAAGFMAQALGVKIPPLGSSSIARVSTGVLYRTVGIARLDFEEEASGLLLTRLLDEAQMQRGGSSDAV